MFRSQSLHSIFNKKIYQHKHDFYMDYESSLVLFQEAKKFENPKRTRVNYLTDLTGIPKKSIENFFSQYSLNLQDLKDLNEGKTLHRSTLITKYDKNEGHRRLLEMFVKNPHPLKDELGKLSKELGASERQLQSWFNKKRRELGISTKNIHYECHNYAPHYRLKGRIKKMLQDEYALNHYISPAKTHEIAERCGLKYKQVQRYFQTQRSNTGQG